jgi:hypothetical protein
MTNSYITLTNSDVSLSKRFLVSQGGYRVTFHEYQIKVRAGRYVFTSSGSYQEVPDDYGILDDLEVFYRYNNPNGTPSNIITMIDHYGNTKSILFVGEFPKTPVSTILDTSQAVYFLPVRFRVIPP